MKILLIMLLFPLQLLAGDIVPLAGFPSCERGYEKGVSACYAGCLGDVLVVAGGANFADKPVAEGGKKCFYKGIYAASLTEADTLDWKQIGVLPEAMAYGAAVVVGERMVFIGGANAGGSLDKVFALTIENGRAVLAPLPSLPVALENFSAATDGSKVFVAGGASNGKEQTAVLVLDFDERKPRWRVLRKVSCVPKRKRIGQQTVSVVVDGRLTVLGGFSGADGKSAAEVYDGPAGGALAQTRDGRIFVAGGVNHDIFLDAISGRYELVKKEDYLKQPVEWYRFDGRLRLFDPESLSFTTLVESPFLARAGASLVAHGDELFSVGGETKPGVRSPLVVRVKLK